MTTQSDVQQKPALVNAIGWMTLASGIVNLFWGLGLALTGLLSILGIVCIPILILPTVLGVFELIYAAKVMSNPPQAIRPSAAIAILEIACVLLGNLFSVVVGILVLVFYNDPSVRQYFSRLNGLSAPVVPEPPAAPAPTGAMAETNGGDAVHPADEDAPAGSGEPSLPAEGTPRHE